jgi:hypothetical protein
MARVASFVSEFGSRGQPTAGFVAVPVSDADRAKASLGVTMRTYSPKIGPRGNMEQVA